MDNKNFINNLPYGKRIDLLDLNRQDIANKLGMSYSKLLARLDGRTTWQPGEELKLQEILEEAELKISNTEKACQEKSFGG